jgi:hypothetical protein
MFVTEMGLVAPHSAATVESIALSAVFPLMFA